MLLQTSRWTICELHDSISCLSCWWGNRQMPEGLTAEEFLRKRWGDQWHWLMLETYTHREGHCLHAHTFIRSLRRHFHNLSGLTFLMDLQIAMPELSHSDTYTHCGQPTHNLFLFPCRRRSHRATKGQDVTDWQTDARRCGNCWLSQI